MSDQHRLGNCSLSLPVHSRSLREVRGCDTWFARASLRSLSDLLVLPGILSLILDRQPLPPLLLLLLLLSLLPPGCHPPFAMLRSPDMMCCINCRKSSLIKFRPLHLSQSHAPLTSAPRGSLTCLHHGYHMRYQSCRMQFVNGGDISNRKCQLQDAAQPCCFPSNHHAPLAYCR